MHKIRTWFSARHHCRVKRQQKAVVASTVAASVVVARAAVASAAVASAVTASAVVVVFASVETARYSWGLILAGNQGKLEYRQHQLHRSSYELTACLSRRRAAKCPAAPLGPPRSNGCACQA
eukprot:1146692-Pelagomonas_calceolata.AAC.3